MKKGFVNPLSSLDALNSSDVKIRLFSARNLAVDSDDHICHILETCVSLDQSNEKNR